MNFRIGSIKKIFFQKDNMNNSIIEIRAVIDGEYVVYKQLPSGNYILQDKSYLDLLFKDGWLTEI